MQFQKDDRIRHTNAATGEVRYGRVVRSAPLKNWRRRIVEPEVLGIIWDDGSIEHNRLPDGIEKI